MSGDSINSLKMVKEEPLNLQDFEYTKKLLEPFDNVVVERFTTSTDSPLGTEPKKSTFNIFVLIAIGLVLLLNFPKVRNELKLNEYIVWIIAAFLLFGSVY
jgi:hypothetical protein